MKHAAKVGISTKLLLDLLDFQGGRIHRVYTPDDYLDPDTFFAVIEHPDLPEVEIGTQLPEVLVSLHTTYGENGVVKIERVDPPS